METEENKEEEVHEGEEIRLSNFSMVIAFIFVTIVMLFLYVKILFD
jgi:hypothetical protein